MYYVPVVLLLLLPLFLSLSLSLCLRSRVPHTTHNKIAISPSALLFLGNGQKRELPVFFGQKRMYPKNHSGRECYWSYLIGQHPHYLPFLAKSGRVLPVIATLVSFHPFLAIFMFLSGGLLDCSNRSTWTTRTINNKISTR